MVRAAIPGRAGAPAALLTIAGLLLLYALLAPQLPHGAWDAWAIWNLRAKVWALGLPGQAFDPALAYSHLDYPPLLPLVIAAGWRVTGWTPWVPIALHGLIYGLLLAQLARRAPAALVLLVGAAALSYALMQGADVLVALSALGAVAAWRDEAPWRAGTWLGIGALTKNEGALLALACLAVWGLQAWRQAIRAAGALAPWVVMLVVYKLTVGAPSDLGSSPAALLARLADPTRYGIIALWALGSLAGFAQGAALWVGLWAWLTRTRLVWSPPAAALSLTFAGYLLVYLVTPHPLVWHLSTSLDRLLLQLFPAMVMALLPARRPLLKEAPDVHLAPSALADPLAAAPRPMRPTRPPSI